MIDMRLFQHRLPALPRDRCPYVSGMAGGFAACPAYNATMQPPVRPAERDVDVYTHTPGPVPSCLHLVTGEAASGRFYPCCRLGTPAARQRYVQAGRGGSRGATAGRRSRKAGLLRPGMRWA